MKRDILEVEVEEDVEELLLEEEEVEEGVVSLTTNPLLSVISVIISDTINMSVQLGINKPIMWSGKRQKKCF